MDFGGLDRIFASSRSMWAALVLKYPAVLEDKASENETNHILQTVNRHRVPHAAPRKIPAPAFHTSPSEGIPDFSDGVPP